MKARLIQRGIACGTGAVSSCWLNDKRFSTNSDVLHAPMNGKDIAGCDVSHQERAFLWEFARRSFRDLADKDYIAARISYWADLDMPFLNLAHQAVERYVKGILVFNLCSAKNLGHSLEKGLRRLKERLPFMVKLSSSTRDMLRYLDRVGGNRYFEFSHYRLGKEIFLFDKCVWELRRYCQAFVSLPDDEVASRRYRCALLERAQASSAENRPHKYSIQGGWLESVLRASNSQSRAHLGYKNFYYGARATRVVKNVRLTMYAQNAPLAVQPHMFGVADRFVDLSGILRKEFRKK